MDGIKPIFKILANDKNITQTIDPRLISIRITDEVGIESDSLEIRICDGLEVVMPNTGAEIRIFVGYDNRMIDMGLFVVDEIQRSGYPREMTIRAKAAIQDKTPKGKKSLRSQQSKEWEKDTTLKSIVQKIEQDHGLKPAISEELAGIKIPHTMQTDESDLNFLMRIAKKYDASVKPANGMLILAKVGTGKSVGGQQVKPVAITEKGVKGYDLSISKREESGTVVAYYHNRKEAKRNSIKVGDGSEPIKRIKTPYGTKDEATSAAKSEFERRERGKNKLSLNVVGNPEIFAEARLTVSGFVGGVNGEWVIKRVEHEISCNDGFTTSIEAETPTPARSLNVEDVEEES